MIFALPSSPHWAPTTTVTGIPRTVLSCTPATVPTMTVMRRQRWADMSEKARERLCARGLDEIFDPTLRASIGELIDDVRERGDAAVCDALARHDGIAVEPDGLRITDDEFSQAIVDPARRRRDRRRHRPSSSVQRATARAHRRLELRVEPGLTVGEKITPMSSAGLFTPSGKASYPSVTYQLAVPAIVAGVPQLALVVPPIPGARRRGRSGGARRLPQARSARRVPRQRSGRHRRARVRHASRSPRCARSSAPVRQRSPSPRSRCSATASRR